MVYEYKKDKKSNKQFAISVVPLQNGITIVLNGSLGYSNTNILRWLPQVVRCTLNFFASSSARPSSFDELFSLLE